MPDITKIALAIVALGLAATVIVNGPKTAQVVGAAATGFSKSISAAEKG